MGTVIGNHSTPRSLAPSARDRAVLGNAHPRMPWQNSLPALKPAHQRQALVSSKAWQHSCLGYGSFFHSHGAQSYPCSCSAARGSSAVPALPSLSPVFPRDPCLAGILAQQANDLCHRALTTKPGSWGWSNSDVLLLARTEFISAGPGPLCTLLLLLLLFLISLLFPVKCFYFYQ